MHFFSEKIYGEHDFRRCYDNLYVLSDKREALVCKLLDICPRTLRDWLSGRKHPSHAACRLLWHESSIGRSAVHMHIEAQLKYAYGYAECLKRDNTLLQAKIDLLYSDIAELRILASTKGHLIAANDRI